MSTSGAENLPSEEESEFFKGWCDTRIKFVKYDYTWTISNFSLCSQSLGEEMKSPTFPDGSESKVKWRLKLYPAGLDKDSKDNVSVFLYVVSCESGGVKAKYKLKVLDLNRKAILTMEGSHLFKQGLDWGYRNMIPLNKVPNDQLIVSCEITAGVEVVNISHQSAITITQQRDLIDDYRDVFENQEFSDVTLVAGEKQFKAHKVILGARSPVFKAMFLHQMQESMQNRVEILDVDPKILNEILRFIYTGQVCNLKNVANSLLPAADKYALESLKVMCEEELCKNVSIENATQVFIIADLHNASKLKLQTKKYIATYAKEITETTGWKSMIQAYPQLVTEVFCDLAAYHISRTDLTKK